MKARFILFLFTFSCFLLPLAHGGFSFLHAQWSTSPDSALQIGVGEFPQIESDGHGGAFVGWNGFDYARIQKLDRYGYVQWTNITPQGGIDIGGNPSDSCYQEMNTNHNAIVPDGQRGVYVMFNDICCIQYCETPYPLWLYRAMLQHIDSLGNLLWGEGLPLTVRNSYETRAGTMVPDGAGGVIALYSERDSIYQPAKLYAQRFDPQGNRLWGNEGVIIVEGSLTKAVSDRYNGVVILGGGRLYRLDSQGQKVWADSGIVAPNGASHIVVDMSDNIYTTMGKSIGNGFYILKVQKLSLIDGSLQWDSLGVTIDTVDVQNTVRGFDVIPNNGVALTWHEEVNPGIWDVFVQWVGEDGQVLYNPGGIPSSIFPSSKHTSVLISSDEVEASIICVWEDLRNPVGFYAQRLDSHSNRLWGQNDIPITIRPAVPTGYDITTDTKGGAIIVWQEEPGFFISVQQVSVNGNLGEVIITTIRNEKNLKNIHQFELEQNYPNPFNQSTVIRYTIPIKQYVTLNLYNLLGERITTLVSEEQNSGYYEIRLEMNDFASGVYYYQLKTDEFNKVRKFLYLK